MARKNREDVEYGKESISRGQRGHRRHLRGVHLPGIEKSPDLRLTAVCDLKPERMAYAREKYGVPEANCFFGLPRPRELPDVDVVDISTSTTHFAVAKAAIEAGKPYCIEKPRHPNGGRRIFSRG